MSFRLDLTFILASLIFILWLFFIHMSLHFTIHTRMCMCGCGEHMAPRALRGGLLAANARTPTHTQITCADVGDPPAVVNPPSPLPTGLEIGLNSG
jgi:hypothetical protein